MATASTGGGGVGAITGPPILSGKGSPEGAVSAQVGSLYRRTDAGEFYLKSSGTGNTGWVEFSDAIDAAIADAIANIADTINTNIQTIYKETNSTTSGALLIPSDNTIPQWSEGTLWSSIATTITPKYSNSIIIGRLSGHYAATAVVTVAFAAFRGSGPDAIATQNLTQGVANTSAGFNLIFKDAPGVTTPVTYNMRFGPNTTATVYLNTGTGGDLYGGTLHTTMTLDEIKQ